MSKIHKDCVAISTERDAHGEEMTEKGVRELFRQTPDPFLLNQGHDITLPPIGRMYNKRLHRLKNGHLAMVVDYEVWGSQQRVKNGGLSVSFVTDLQENPSESMWEVEVLFNPRVFQHDDLKELVAITDLSTSIHFRRLHQKSVEETAILIIKIVAEAMVIKLLGQAASEPWKEVKRRISAYAKKFKQENARDLSIHFTYPHNLNNAHCEIVIAFSQGDLENFYNGFVDIEAAQKFLLEVVGKSQIMRAVVRPKRESPYFELVQIVDSEGKLISL